MPIVISARALLNTLNSWTKLTYFSMSGLNLGNTSIILSNFDLMKLIYILLLFAIGFYSCIEADIDYKFDYEERPASIGFLDSVWGIRVWVGKTASVLGKDSSKVAGAEASFHTISGLISSLKSIGNGNFILDNPTALNLTDKFYFKSKSINFPNELTSNQEGIPAQVNLKKVDIVKIGNGSGRDIFIEFDDPPGFNAYVTYIQRFKKDTAMDEDFNADPTFLPFYSGLINDREFNGRRHTLRIENYQIEKVIDQRRNQEHRA